MSKTVTNKMLPRTVGAAPAPADPSHSTFSVRLISKLRMRSKVDVSSINRKKKIKCVNYRQWTKERFCIL